MRYRGGTPRSLLVLLSLAALFLGGCTVPAATPPGPEERPPPDLYGIHEDIHYDQYKIAPMLDRIVPAGLRWVRFQMLWTGVQSGGPDQYGWGVYDTAFAQLHSRGVRPLAVLNGTPTWARPAGCTGDSCPPRDPAEFARFAATAAQRYPGTTWEIWNEPNIQSAWASPDPAKYTELLKAAYAAIKKTDPSATVISAGLSPTGTVEGKVVSPIEYLSGMYDAGAGRYLDGVGWHPYTFRSDFGRYKPDSGWSQMADTPVSARSIMIDHGDAAKKIWATEFGDSTSPGNSTEDQQADLIARAIHAWAGYDFAGPLIIYNYQDRQNDAGRTKSDLYGITRSDDSPKPALGVITETIPEVLRGTRSR
ncbi:glycoside hydrolase 5 family protein [Pseudonocardia phyllosphaerae]|uniref:hypothetical protein n=1 Tax=Pseudonocardia phyllosphaerae TaxID=3390502 RepID=UPI003978987E